MGKTSLLTDLLCIPNRQLVNMLSNIIGIPANHSIKISSQLTGVR
ncbi:hypothetical protein FDUTEX481_06871 [Tolypothrix sp. PCC 7601]|nr:hypothetical protein FDUTEX481_06871 [Tolypothrix sp. PCC 7601]